MIQQISYQEAITSLRGKTIAIVYVFEGEDAKGSTHYDIWRSDVLTAWLRAVQEIRCLPLILDVRTFVQKAMNYTLPQVDYVINLNNGTIDLSTLGLVPSTCAFLGIPCIPCNANTTLIGENKYVSNLIANASGITTPRELRESDDNGINRPNSMGSSIGITKGRRKPDSDLYQEFIPGFDMTTPMLYHPVLKRLETLPPIMYLPNSLDPHWFLGAKEKASHAGYSKLPVAFDDETHAHFLNMAAKCGITTYCRIDCRILCGTSKELQQVSQEIIPFSRVRFIEINPMPTIKEGVNFLTSLSKTSCNSPFYTYLDHYRNIIKNSSLTGFILSCAIFSLSKPNIKEGGINSSVVNEI